MDLQPIAKKQVRTRIDAERIEYLKNKKPDDPKHYFQMMRSLQGFFTSESGATSSLGHVPVPGSWVDAFIRIDKNSITLSSINILFFISDISGRVINDD